MKRFINPVPQYFDGEGNVLSGGKVYFYENGSTTTLKDTFNSDGGSANTNPVTLSAEGRLPPVFGDGLYTEKVTNADGVQQWIRHGVDFSGSDGQYSEYSLVTSYSINDTVKYTDGNYYISLANNNIGSAPNAAPSKWSKIAFFEFWNVSRPGGYGLNSVVIRDGYLYRSTTASNVTAPPSATWENLTFNNAIAGDLSVSGTLTVGGILSGSNLNSGGSFTPTIIGTSSAGVGTYSVQYGNYSRVGNYVIGSLSLEWSAHTGTGNIRIDGLPAVASSPGETNAGGINVAVCGFLTYGAGKQLTGVIQHNTQNILLYAIESNTAASAVAIDTAGSISLTFMYRVAP